MLTNSVLTKTNKQKKVIHSKVVLQGYFKELSIGSKRPQLAG